MANNVYYVNSDLIADEGFVFAIVAQTGKEAKKIAMKDRDFEYDQFTSIRVKLAKKNVDLPKGTVDSIEGLKIGVYGWVFGDCPVCGKQNIEIYNEEIIACSSCCNQSHKVKKNV